jgi:hypothetical protein
VHEVAGSKVWKITQTVTKTQSLSALYHETDTGSLFMPVDDEVQGQIFYILGHEELVKHIFFLICLISTFILQNIFFK